MVGAHVQVGQTSGKLFLKIPRTVEPPGQAAGAAIELGVVVVPEVFVLPVVEANRPCRPTHHGRRPALPSAFQSAGPAGASAFSAQGCRPLPSADRPAGDRQSPTTCPSIPGRGTTRPEGRCFDAGPSRARGCRLLDALQDATIGGRDRSLLQLPLIEAGTSAGHPVVDVGPGFIAAQPQ